ncbi:MAG: hypothetical protein HQ594_02125, partial [Candidatus Omnitrophica bacterium]|nr:hypothetical protein [Candidatus Omnitrophota bacterium]
MRKALIIIFLGVFAAASLVSAQDAKDAETLSLDEFIVLACARDKVFEQILIENLKLNYKKKLELPADDIVIAAKSAYETFVKYNDQGYPIYEVLLS